MSDKRLRELERRFLQTGDPADEVTYLRQAVRGEAIARDRVAIASWLGHAPAREALGGEQHGPADEDREGWIRCTFHPVEVAVLACFPHMPDKDRYPGPARRALAATRAWLRAPTEASGEIAAQVASDFWSDPKTFPFGSEPSFYVALRASHFLVRAVQAPTIADPEQESAALAEHQQYAELMRQRGASLPPHVPFAVRPLCLQAMRCAVDALVAVCGHSEDEARQRGRSAQLRWAVPWLLDRRDPLREREHVPTEAHVRIQAAEAAVEESPRELARIEQLVAVCNEAGWTWDGKTLAEWTAQLCGDWNLAKVAVGHMTALGPRAVPAALAALDVKRYQTPGFGVQLLRSLGDDAAAAIPALLELLRGRVERGDSGTSSWVNLLGLLGAEEAVQPLIDLLIESADDLGAGQALLRIGEPAFAPLTALLRERGTDIDDAAVRYAAFVLAQRGQERALVVPILEGILAKHPWHYQRSAAFSGLLSLGCAEAQVDAVVGWLHTTEDEYKIGDPVQALGLLKAAATHPEARTALESLLNHDRPSVREGAQAALAGEAEPWRHSFWSLPS